MEVAVAELQEAIQRQYGCTARLAHVDPVSLEYGNSLAWEGLVHVFDVTGRSDASRAYAWTSAIESSTKRRFYAVLGKPPINSAADAVRAAIVAEQRANKRQ
jgi:hypothetical protein